MTQEVLKLALDALETELSIDWTNNDEFNASAEKMHKAIAAIKEALAQEQDIAALVTGMEVSIDVSTGVHDSGNRLFGVVDLVQENQGSKHNLILLVQEPKANFKEALAQPEQEPVACNCNQGQVCHVCDPITPPQRTEQEPVAWRTFDGEGQYQYRAYEENETYADDWNKRNPNHKGWVEPLYTHSPQRTWVGLTDVEIDYLLGSTIGENEETHISFARAIESKLKERNT
jgi:hypothetical protein